MTQTLVRSFLALGLGLSALAPATKAHSATPTLPTLSQADFNSVIREVSANTMLHSVTPASSMGSIFGFEVGVVAGATSVPEMNRLVGQASPGNQFKYLPHAGLMGAVTVPFGITGEAVVVPKVAASGVDYSSYALALKWNLSDSVLPILPLNVAVRGFLARSEISFNQTINNASTGGNDVNAGVKFAGQVTGAQLMVSPKLLPIIEPYAALGFLSATGQLDVNAAGGGTLLGFTNAQSAQSNPTSSHLILGADIRLLVIGFGVEYAKAFDTETYTGKLSLKF